jgi:hypothetical protein
MSSAGQIQIRRIIARRISLEFVCNKCGWDKFNRKDYRNKKHLGICNIHETDI